MKNNLLKPSSLNPLDNIHSIRNKESSGGGGGGRWEWNLKFYP